MANCPIDGTKIGFLGGTKLKDGEICLGCSNKVGFAKGDTVSDMVVGTYTVAEVKELIEAGKHFDPDHAKKARQADIERSLAESDPEFIRAKLLAQYGLNDLDPDTAKAVNQIIDKMSNMSFARIVGTLNGLKERYQITLNQTQIEQNWILIKQQDETNKLLRQLVDKK